MAAQGIWSGTISFSLVAIPVRLVKAVETGRISFHLLHSKDYSRLNRKMYCSQDNAPVPPDEIARGYEITPGKFILMTDEELESVSPERSRTIEITGFVDLADLDAVFFDHPYYLMPAKGGEKAYRLLVEVMQRTKKAGLASFVLAEREHPVAVFSRDGALAMATLHYGEEVLPFDAGVPQKAKIDQQEAGRMRKSVERMLVDFEPSKYANGRLNKISEIVARKIKESALVDAPAISAEEEEGPPDLVAALEESMRHVKENR